MVEQLKKHIPTADKPAKLILEDLTLFHVTTSYGVSEPTASKIVQNVEECLMQSNF